MQNISTLYDELIALLPADSPPYLLLIYKVAIAVAGFIVIWIILRWLLHFVERRLKKYEFVQENSRVFQLIRRVSFLALLLVVGTYLLRMTAIPILEKVFHALLIIFLAVPVKNFLTIAIGFLQTKIAHQTANKVDDIIFELLSRFAGFIIIATAFIIALDSLGVNVMPFIAGAGVAGVAIGFAAKDTLSNLIAGILLIIDRPFEVGDRIEVWSAPSGTSTWGDVIDIGLRATKIKTTDNIVIIIPNNEIMLRDIINYTTISERIRVRINIGIAYDADIQKAKDVILKVAGSAQWVANDPAPKVVVRKFGESAIDLQLRVWIDDARRRMNTISYITDRVKTAFDEHGLEIPYPRRVIYVKKGNFEE
jgi:small-conductance mechanosensitive channel